MTRRVQIGDRLRLVTRTPNGVELEGAARLRPGQPIEIVDVGGTVMGAASVQSWGVARLGKDGPIYRGTCVWQ